MTRPRHRADAPSRLRFAGARVVRADEFRRAVAGALWHEADLAAATAAAALHAAWIGEGRVWWYPFAIDAHRTRLLDRLGLACQVFPWDAGADDLPLLCAQCLAWLQSDPAAPLPGAPFLVRGQAALWQCPECGGVFEDDPSAARAGLREALSPRMLRERHATSPPAPPAPWALPG